MCVTAVKSTALSVFAADRPSQASSTRVLEVETVRRKRGYSRLFVGEGSVVRIDRLSAYVILLVENGGELQMSRSLRIRIRCNRMAEILCIY